MSTQLSPVLFLPFSYRGDTLHEFVAQFVEDRLVKLQSWSPMKIQKWESRLQRWQQNAIFRLKKVLDHLVTVCNCKIDRTCNVIIIEEINLIKWRCYSKYTSWEKARTLLSMCRCLLLASLHDWNE